MNGVITYAVDMRPDYDLGTVATHSCNQGYVLRGGNDLRTCEDAGDGSGSIFSGQVPTCQRKI